MLAAVILIANSKPLSYEKRLFLRILEAYEYIESFNALSGSSSQEESNLLEAEKSLERVSERLLENKGEKNTYDLFQAAINKYAKIGELIQTKILFYLRNKKELLLIQQKILVLANGFAEASSSRLDSCITSIDTIPEKGELKPRPSFLQSRPRLRSLFIRSGKLAVSIFTVVVVAYGLSILFSRPLSDFAVEILVATFVVFAAWENRSK